MRTEAELKKIKAKGDANYAKSLEAKRAASAKKNAARARLTESSPRRLAEEERLSDARAYRERRAAERAARTEAIRVSRAAAALARPGGAEKALAKERAEAARIASKAAREVARAEAKVKRIEALALAKANQARIIEEARAYAAANPRTFPPRETQKDRRRARSDAEAKARALTALRVDDTMPHDYENPRNRIRVRP